jgi:hypothetical protein
VHITQYRRVRFGLVRIRLLNSRASAEGFVSANLHPGCSPTLRGFLIHIEPGGKGHPFRCLVTAAVGSLLATSRGVDCYINPSINPHCRPSLLPIPPIFSGYLFRLLTQIALYLFVAVYKPGMGKRICLIQTDEGDSMVER